MERRKFYLEEQMCGLINKVVNIDKRNIVIVGNCGTGKTVLLDYITRLCEDNRIRIDGIDVLNADLVIQESEFNCTMMKLAGMSTTLIIDEPHTMSNILGELIGSHTKNFGNYIITTHGYGDNTSRIDIIMGRNVKETDDIYIISTYKDINGNYYVKLRDGEGREIISQANI